MASGELAPPPAARPPLAPRPSISRSPPRPSRCLRSRARATAASAVVCRGREGDVAGEEDALAEARAVGSARRRPRENRPLVLDFHLQVNCAAITGFLLLFMSCHFDIGKCLV
uniref:Uncharacterized protein n=1 Tax=Setaria viridis TaxID=4556 RepID=A0A4U6WC57_SETVI|nr:hypothetical protein SEVIR_2G366501v2 [Setaria viridis]